MLGKPISITDTVTHHLLPGTKSKKQQKLIVWSPRSDKNNRQIKSSNDKHIYNNDFRN